MLEKCKNLIESDGYFVIEFKIRTHFNINSREGIRRYIKGHFFLNSEPNLKLSVRLVRYSNNSRHNSRIFNVASDWRAVRGNTG